MPEDVTVPLRFLFPAPLFGDFMSFNEIVGTLNRQGHNFSFKQVPKEVFAALFPGAAEGAETFRYFQLHTYLGSDWWERIALANKIAGGQATQFSTWARPNVPVQTPYVRLRPSNSAPARSTKADAGSPPTVRHLPLQGAGNAHQLKPMPVASSPDLPFLLRTGMTMAATGAMPSSGDGLSDLPRRQ